MPASNSHSVLRFSDRSQPQAIYFLFSFRFITVEIACEKKHEIWEQKLWSERFLIYSRLRQMNIESLFCNFFVLCANISSISIGGKVARESAARQSSQNLAIFETHAHSCAFRFFSSRDHALHVDLLSFIQDVEAAARWLRLRREGKYFRWTFGKLLVTHASGGKYLSRQYLTSTESEGEIRYRERKSFAFKSLALVEWENYVNSWKRQTKENKSKIVWILLANLIIEDCCFALTS